ncbi:MAG TPA: glycosyl hydrolase, partial [Terriglobales bacterium]|nr:glycosyl hydrolase [Terriglobales bacterium]
MRHIILALLLLTTAFSFTQEKKTKPAQAKKEVAAQQPQTPAAKPDDKPADPFSTGTFNGLKLRLIGPAQISGRIVSIAVNPRNHSEFYIGVASGGVWKTINGGTTFTPVFDGEGSYSIGYITVDPFDPNVVWVGTGENNSQRSVAYGDGIYKSEDAGKTWTNMGLKHSEHIGRIVVDPRDSKTVFVAAEGPLWSAGGDRGLYKTKDGGKNWEKILNVSENTGFSDLVMDPENPDTMYASAYQRRRHVWTLIDGGPESAIYKTTDGGATWNKLKNGLPTVDMGRIGLAVSPANPNVVYATIEAADGKSGVYRSMDKGSNWERRNPFESGSMYYAQIFADPKNVDRIYIGSVFLKVSDDGGKTIRNLGEKNKHVDNHVIWIDPENTNHYLVGCDGGLYESFDRAENWRWFENLPLGQFYRVSVDNSLPFYRVYGGTQDNSTWGAPSRSLSVNGITNADWEFIQGGDGFHSQVDPEDPNTVYAEYQYGNIIRYNRKTGEAVGIIPPEPKGGPPYRYNWDSPILVSSHDHRRVYFAANVLFRSDDRGDNWQAISPDLTRQIDRNKLPVMGKVWGPDAVAKNQSTSFYGNIVSLSESPKKDGVFYVGTDDGLVQVTEDGGKTWTKHDTFPGVPDRSYVSKLLASNHDAAVVYAAFENHKQGDFKPYLFRSSDNGRTWTSISANLPENGYVHTIAEDPVNPKLLFVGTEFGLWFSIDGGAKWVQLKGGDFPTIAVHDLVIQKRESDLVVGTFGRSIYILDDYSPLRALTPQTLTQDVVTLPIKPTLMYVPTRPIGGRGKGFMGETYYTAENPPYGASFTYYMKDKVKTRKELRQEAEKEATKANKPITYPTNDELRAEIEEQAPEVFFVVYDETGRPLRRVNAPNAKGYQRAAWDLRYPAAVLTQESADEGDEDFPPAGNQGPLVMPGPYSVRMFKKSNGTITEIGQAQKFDVTVAGQESMNAQDRTALRDFQRKVTNLYRAVSGAINTANETKKQLKDIRRALQETPTADPKLGQIADQLDQRNNDLLRLLRGDVTLAARNENVPASINDRVSDIMEGQRFAILKPTGTHVKHYEIASQEFADVLAKMHQLVDVDLNNLEKQLEAAGAPWTPGRVP